MKPSKLFKLSLLGALNMLQLIYTDRNVNIDNTIKLGTARAQYLDGKKSKPNYFD